jgi:hypothetical protein
MWHVPQASALTPYPHMSTNHPTMSAKNHQSHDFVMPQYRLPVEVLEKIFKFSPPVFAIENGHLKQYPPILVCKYWKDVAYGATGLWNTIFMDISQWSCKSTLKLLQVWTQKASPTRGLYLDIQYGHRIWLYPGSPLKSVIISNLEGLSGIAERLELLRITCYSDLEVKTIVRVLHLAKRIKVLNLIIHEYLDPHAHKFSHPDPNYHDHSFNRAATLPALRTLQIQTRSTAHPVPLPVFSGLGVTRLALQFGIFMLTPFKFAELCQGLPNIESLRLCGLFFTTSEQEQGGDESPQLKAQVDVKSWGADFKDKMVLHRLQTLILEYGLYATPHAVVACGPNLANTRIDAVACSGSHGDLVTILRH